MGGRLYDESHPLFHMELGLMKIEVEVVDPAPSKN